MIVVKGACLEKVLDLFGLVAVALATDALDFLHLPGATSGLNVLEMHHGVLAEINDGAQKVVEAFEALEGFENVNERQGAQLLRVLARHLHHNLQVLAHVDGQHFAQALDGLFDRQAAEKSNDPFGVEQVRVDNGALNVVNVRIMFQRLM